MNSYFRYCIADDHAIFRQGVRHVLRGIPTLSCVGEAGNGLELLRLLETAEIDVVLLDLRMPAMDGVEALAALRRKHPAVKVIILTMQHDEGMLLHLLEKGANGYLLKNAEPEEIATALQSACEMGYYFNDLVSTALLKKITRPAAPARPHIEMTDRERDVLRLICAEQTTTEIAGSLRVSVRTVESIRSVLLQKLGARNTAGLVLHAVRAGLVAVD